MTASTGPVGEPDPTRCPDCGGAIASGLAACVACGLALQGAAAQELWQVTVELARLGRRRELLLTQLRPGAARGDVGSLPAPPPAWPPQTAPAPQRAAPPRGWTPPPATSPPATSPPAWAPPAPKPRAEWTPQRVQNLLLTVGALLVVVAALIFAAVAFGRIGTTGRAVIMVALTAAAAASAPLALRRQLGSTAEALATIAALLCLVDAYAARRLGLAGLDAADESTYWSTATAVVAVLALAYSLVVPVRATRLVALFAGQLPLLVYLGGQDGIGPDEVAAATTAQAVALVAVEVGLRTRTLARETQVGAMAAAIVTWALTVVAVAPLGIVDPKIDGRDASSQFAVALVACAAGAAAAALLWRRRDWLRDGAAAGATGCLTVAVLIGARADLTDVQVPAAVAAVGLLTVVGAGAMSRTWRRGPQAVGTLTVATSVLLVARDAFLGLVGPLGWLAEPWTRTSGTGAREALRPSHPWDGSVVVLVVLTVAALTAVLTGELARRRDLAAAPAVALLSATLLLVPLGQAWSYPAAVGWDVATGALLLAAGTAVRQRGRPSTALGMQYGGAAVAAIGLAWSLADERTTLVVVALGAIAPLALAVVDRVARLAAAGACTALSAGWAYAVARSVETPYDRSGFVLAAVGCAGVGVAAVLSRQGTLLATSVVVEATSAVAAGAGLLLTVADPGWLSWTLALTGVTALADAVRADRRQLAWVGGLLLTGCSWVRLYLEEVREPEAYAAPLAAVALILGHLRRRRDPACSSWSAYGAGLGLAFGPSLYVAVTEEDVLRPVLLCLVALVVLLVGAHQRLQAPLAIGAATLAANAVAQAAPYADTVPRWMSIGGAGLLVLAVGATYEQRRRDVQRLRERFDALG